jgi:hypothetical protein
MSSKYFKRRRKTKRPFKNLSRPIPLDSQFERIKSSFPNLAIKEKKNDKFTVIIKLRPDLFSKEYEVKIVYETYKPISVYIVNEVLEIAENRNKLPHVYNNKLQKICLYAKDGGRWDSSKSIVSTIIPWASEWLFYYELWLIDGIWQGGGHDEYINENFTKHEQ